jgi:GT2 family glycosyltransferase
MPPGAEQSDDPGRSMVDIVICIHDALDHARECLASLNRHSDSRQHLIIVDDGSSPGCRDELVRFGQAHGQCTLIRNDKARGYTKAANQGLHLSRADVVILLNSDTVVTANWLDRLLSCADSDPRIGIVGPLSNAAGYQSVPEVFGETETPFLLGGEWMPWQT